MQATQLLEIGVQERLCLPSLPFHEAMRWTERHLRARSRRRGTCALPLDGWELCHQTVVRGVPQNPRRAFWGMQPPKQLSSGCSAVWVALLLLPGGMHRQGCCLAGASCAWPEGTWRRRAAAMPCRDPKRERDSLEECEMRAGWVRFISFDSFLCA